eukprot:732885-Pelagomonas_calceolata.AAC.4
MQTGQTNTLRAKETCPCFPHTPKPKAEALRRRSPDPLQDIADSQEITAAEARHSLDFRSRAVFYSKTAEA